MRHNTISCASLLLALLWVTSSFAQSISAVTVGASRQVRTTRSGTKADVLKMELLNFRICPTRGTLDLLEKLNPQFRGSDSIDEGTSVLLPLLNEASPDMQQQIDRFLTQDNAVSDTGNTQFLKNSQALQAAVSSWMMMHWKKGPLTNDLREINSLLENILQQPEAKLRKYHTDIINNEMEQFANYLRIRSSGKMLSVPPDTAYVHAFHNYFFQVVGPYYLPATDNQQRPESHSGLKSIKRRRIDFRSALPDPASTAVDVSIHVQIPVLSQNKFRYVDSMNQYWVYCLSEFQFDNLNSTLMGMKPADKHTLPVDRLKTLITVDDLERTKSLCPSPASVTARRIDTRFPYHFIVVSLDKRNILIHDWIDLATYAFKLEDGQYGLGLYQNIHW
jgi:hypothetical protein